MKDKIANFPHGAVAAKLDCPMQDMRKNFRVCIGYRDRQPDYLEGRNVVDVVADKRRLEWVDA